MSSVQTALLGRTTVVRAAGVESLALYRVAFWVLLSGNLIAGWGVQWDIQWHVRVGRDSFWIPPHVIPYSGVPIVVLVSFGVLARDTFRHLFAGRAPQGTTRVAGEAVDSGSASIASRGPTAGRAWLVLRGNRGMASAVISEL